MNILAIDTSAEHLSISIVQNHQLLANYYSLCKKKNSQILFSVLDELIINVNMDLSQIDLYVVNKGPGSYTGVRIGMGVIKTLAQVHQKPIVAVNSLELLASLTLPTKVPFYALLNCTRREFFYAQFQYKNDTLIQLNEIQMELLNNFPLILQTVPLILQRFSSVSAIPVKYFETLNHLPKKTSVPDAYQLIQLGQKRWQERGEDVFEEVHPLYVKKDL